MKTRRPRNKIRWLAMTTLKVRGDKNQSSSKQEKRRRSKINEVL